MRYLIAIILLCSFLLNSGDVSAQPGSDTTRLIEILPGSRSLRQKQTDSVTLIMLAGNASVRQGNTIISGDSIVVNQATGVAEVFGNVHINNADSVQTYAQYLRYIGKDRIAYLKRSVKLTDGKGILYTDDLEYNLTTGIATYKNGGRVVNGRTILTSSDAVYYSDTKDVYFKKYVHLTDPKYDIVADSLLYNTELKEAHFIAPTRIKTKEGGIINTKNGIYNLETGEARFFDRTSLSDSTHYISANNIFSDDKTGIAVAEGNAKFVDSVNNVTVIANKLEVNRKENSFLATQKPVMILYRKGDSTYIAADTLFSGLRKFDASTREASEERDTLKGLEKVNVATSASSNSRRPSVGNFNNRFLNGKDSLRIPVTDSISRNKDRLIIASSDSVTVTDSMRKTMADTAGLNNILPVFKADSIKQVKAPDSNIRTIAQSDSVARINAKQKTAAQDSVRYFLGFHNVRIFNDSLQAVSDSMYYSTEDSVFRLFQKPVFWNGKTQVSGDTMYLFTETQKPKRLYVFFNSLVISKENEAMYNQVGGRTLNAYFKEGNIDYIRIKGSQAESVFYPQDDDSAYIGMNRSSGDVIDVYFVNKALNKIKFINNVDGTLYPLKSVADDQKYLKGFLWQDVRRPKNKLELFE